MLKKSSSPIGEDSSSSSSESVVAVEKKADLSE